MAVCIPSDTCPGVRKSNDDDGSLIRALSPRHRWNSPPTDVQCNDDDDENDDEYNAKEAVVRWESYFGNNHHRIKSFDESFKKTGASAACDDCWKKGAAATDGVACNAMLLPPTAPSMAMIRHIFPVGVERVTTSNGEKSGLSATERKEKRKK